MSFQFFRASGAVLDLEAHLNDVVDIEAGVEWSIHENYTLVIKTPKHIGYQAARLKKGVDLELEYASTVDKNGKWVFEDLSFGPLNFFRRQKSHN